MLRVHKGNSQPDQAVDNKTRQFKDWTSYAILFMLSGAGGHQNKASSRLHPTILAGHAGQGLNSAWVFKTCASILAAMALTPANFYWLFWLIRRKLIVCRFYYFLSLWEYSCDLKHVFDSKYTILDKADYSILPHACHTLL